MVMHFLLVRSTRLTVTRDDYIHTCESLSFPHIRTVPCLLLLVFTFELGLKLGRLVLNNGAI